MRLKEMYCMKQSRQENLIYLVVWGLLFAAPLLSLYVRTVGDETATFQWNEVLIVWKKFAVFLLLFLIHNFLLAPLLIYGHKRLTYFAFVAVLLGTFTVYQCSSRPEKPDGLPQKEMVRHDFPGPPDRPEGPGRPAFPGPPDRPPKPRHDFRPADAPPPIVGERDILAIVLLLLMFGANLGIKGYFRSRDDRKKLAELEKQNLEQQLEYLRYQINPHFFMNTLNNIHALVDIDPAKAQETIVELSKMMRFVLYEGNKQGVPLSREFDFIRHYVALMQLRYTDRVSISIDLPQEVPDRQIPPLILITFIENAFKHGVSYQRPSFIEMQVSVEDDRLHFRCRNSKAEAQPALGKAEGGVGLVNVRKRLNLLFGSNYTLNIQEGADVYCVDLVIPIKLQTPPLTPPMKGE